MLLGTLEGKGDLLLFSESLPLAFLKNMSIEISLLSEMRKIKLLDTEQIIPDLNVSTYISFIHPLNPCLPTLNTLEDYQRRRAFQR